MKKLNLSICVVLVMLLACGEANFESKTITYYVNSQIGNDTNNGLSKNSAWQNLEKLADIIFQPGDSILFAKNSVFEDGVIFKSSGTIEDPIIISNYGEGLLPSFSNSDGEKLHGNVFQIEGKHIILEGLSFSKCANSISQGGKDVLSVGAVCSMPGADFVTIKNSVFTDCPIGVNIISQHCLVTNNVFKDCNRFLSEPDWGPLGIVIGNANNEISYNTCTNYVKVGGNYGADGGFIELDDRYFGTKVHDIKIHHNKSFDNMGFLEIETNIEGDNIDVYYNLSDDYQQFIFYWGGNNSKIENNTVIRTKPALNGAVNTVFTMRNGNFSLRNNIFVVANGVQVLVTAPYDVGNYNQVVHEHNLYYCIDNSTNDPCGKPLGKGEIIANPKFVDINADDYRLTPESPAIDAGKIIGYDLDLDNVVIGKNQIPDMGAYEKRD